MYRHSFLNIKNVAEENIVLFYVGLARWAVAQWLWYCATNRHVAGSIPVGAIGMFH